MLEQMTIFDLFEVDTVDSRPLPRISQPPPEPEVEWSDQDILFLRDGILCMSIRMLDDGRVADEQKQEIREWVLSESKHPFSFEICCLASGLNPTVLRDALAHLLVHH